MSGDRPGVVRVPLRDMRINLANPRKHVDERELAELAESIRQHGLLQPILVRPLTEEERRKDKRKYQIVIGSRRFFAAERAGLAAIDCYVRGMSSDEAVVASFLDHALHHALTPAEEADFVRYLRDERKMRLREIAAILNKSIAYVSRRLGVSASRELDTAVRAGRITQAAAQEILRAPEPWWPLLVEHAAGLTSDEVRSLVDEVAGTEPTPEARGRLFAGRKKAASRPSRRPPRSVVEAENPYDEAFRQNSAVTHIPPSPAFALLRLVNDWCSALPKEWQPSPADVQILKEAADLIASAAKGSSSPSSRAG